ncbi:MAG TPA: RluA family pseudouridine synthase, partial [Tepidisphaeraceae bacterium]
MSDSTPAVRSLLDACAALRPASSKTYLRALLAQGRVTINGRVVKIGKTEVGARDQVQIIDAPPKAKPQEPFEIVHHDEDLLVINKPIGLLTSTVPREKRPTALALARDYIARVQPAAVIGLVHRLDRDASGLLVFSLNQPALASLKEQFYYHKAGRKYAAVVKGKVNPPADTISSRLVEYADGTVHRTTHKGRGDDAITHYETAQRNKDHTLLHVTLETGRKHQIRAHLAQRGHPIYGDSLYNGPPAERLMLHALELRLKHPRTGGSLTFTTNLPEA